MFLKPLRIVNNAKSSSPFGRQRRGIVFRTLLSELARSFRSRDCLTTAFRAATVRHRRMAHFMRPNGLVAADLLLLLREVILKMLRKNQFSIFDSRLYSLG